MEKEIEGKGGEVDGRCGFFLFVAPSSVAQKINLPIIHHPSSITTLSLPIIVLLP
jgi:hypothetical protein